MDSDRRFLNMMRNVIKSVSDANEKAAIEHTVPCRFIKNGTLQF